MVDDALSARVVPFIEPDRDRKKEDKAKTGPPTVGEWHDWISRKVIRLATDYYVEAAFNGIDEDLLTARETERVRLTDEDCDVIGKPVAEFFNKWSFTRKHGRAIISGTGSAYSLVILGRWFIRVNRTASKYRNPQKPKEGRVVNNERSRQGTPDSNQPRGYTIIQPGTG